MTECSTHEKLCNRIIIFAWEGWEPPKEGIVYFVRREPKPIRYIST